MIAIQGEADALAPPEPTARNMARFHLGDERRSEWQAIKLPHQFDHPLGYDLGKTYVRRRQ